MTFDKATVRNWLATMAQAIQQLSANSDLKVNEPTDKWFHAFGGQGGQNGVYKFAVALILTTDEHISSDFMQQFNAYAKTLNAGKPLVDLRERTFSVVAPPERKPDETP
jgi:hypothetical protein